MKITVFAKCFMLCLMTTLGFGQAVLPVERIGSWQIGIGGYSLINREDTYGEAVIFSFNCYSDQLTSRFSGLDYLMFEDPSTVDILYRTEDGTIESLQWGPGDVSGYVLVADSFTSTLISHLTNSSELTIQVSAGGYERTHSFEVSELETALAVLPCQ